MKRLILLFTAVMMVFAASGIHKTIAAESIQQTSNKIQFERVLFDKVQDYFETDCCAGMSVKEHSPHDHCNMTCAILPSANRADRDWQKGTISEFPTDNLSGNPLDLMKRPPRNLI